MLIASKLQARGTDGKMLRGPHLRNPALLLTFSLEKACHVFGETNSSHACASFLR